MIHDFLPEPSYIVLLVALGWLFDYGPIIGTPPAYQESAVRVYVGLGIAVLVVVATIVGLLLWKVYKGLDDGGRVRDEWSGNERNRLAKRGQRRTGGKDEEV